jgi:8-amino-7-oxononanoate synthase
MRASADIFECVRNDPEMARFGKVLESGYSPYFRSVDGAAGPTTVMDGREVIMLGSNNYLGLTTDPRVIDGAKDALGTYGAGLTGSRLLNGTTALHEKLESELAEWYGTESAVVFTTGYQANLAVMSAIATGEDSIVCDSADHASILDGINMSSARVRPFRHGRVDKLEAALERACRAGGGILAVVDGVFSMEGDVANLAEIVPLCVRHGARLVVDEAHAVGVLGARGTGSAELFGIEADVDIRIGTFSKSLGTCGGFVVSNTDVADFLRVKSRPFLFTAASVPAAMGAALAAVRICRSIEGAELFAAVLANARYLRAGLVELGLDVGQPSSGPDGPVITPIVPIRAGDEIYAVALWKALWDAGIFTNVAMYPAVQEGRALLRLSVMATHTREHLDRALDAFRVAVPQAQSEVAPIRALQSDTVS